MWGQQQSYVFCSAGWVRSRDHIHTKPVKCHQFHQHLYHQLPHRSPTVPHCNVPLHLVTLPGNRTHEEFRGSFPMSRGPLILFVTTSIMFLFHCLHCPDTRHYVIVTTLFSHPIIICPVIIVVRHIVRN